MVLTTLFVEDESWGRTRLKRKLPIRIKSKEQFDFGSILWPQTIASLLAVLRGVDYDEQLQTEVELIGVGHEEEMHRLPTEIVQALVNADSVRLATVAKKWRLLEPTFDRITDDQLTNALIALRQVSVVSLELKKPILIYVTT